MNISERNIGESTDPRSANFAEQFGRFLLERGTLDELAVRRAQRAQQQSGEHFNLVLTRLGLIPETELAKSLADYCGLRLVTGLDFPDVALFASELPLSFLASNHVLPIAESDESVDVALADPFNSEAVTALSYLTGRPIHRLVATEGEIDRGIERLYAGTATPTAPAAPREAASAPAEASDDDVRRLEDMASEAPVIRLVQDLIVRAVEAQASDIHIEPREDCVRVRYRIDGVLHTVETLSLSSRAAISSRIKIMARLNIAERRLPQDGRIKVNVRGREIDLRVSTMPTLWGESVVMRILDRSSIALDFPVLGFEGAAYEDFARLLSLPNGIILVTGPTGSGKTTTLYTALSALNNSERKIFTVEDPIEYQLPGVNQIQVQPKIGMTFAHALRSILRQDPDIIMVGEIRDLETAQIAIQASLTGHLVLSTVHTNSATATVTRLLDMGVERYLLSACLKGVLAQRLVRKLCDHCATPAPDDPGLSALLKRSSSNAPDIRKASGCPACRQKGYTGRTTIYELLQMTGPIREAIHTARSEHEIEAIAVASGMVSMQDCGFDKVLRGVTTPEEVLRVTRLETCLASDTAPTTQPES